MVWCSAEQAPLVRETAATAGLTVVAIGSERISEATELAAQFNARRVDDPRQFSQATEADLLWLAAGDSLNAEMPGGMDVLDRPIVTLQPPLGSLTDASNPPECPTAVFVPLMRRSPGFEAAAQVLPQFGPVLCVNVFLRSGPGQGTLASRLFDAMDVVNTLCGAPETINAALAGPLAEVPERLSVLCGHMTLNLRFKANRCGCVALSDRAGTWFRGVTVLGDHGHLRISDTGFEWIGVDGTLIDRHAEPASSGLPALIAGQLKHLLVEHPPSDPPMDHVALMALFEAARLSCLTGQDESPAKLIHMMSKL